MKTNLTAVVACVSNIGYGFGGVVPAGNFAQYSPASKFLFFLLMLAGRLELFPAPALLHPSLWRQ